MNKNKFKIGDKISISSSYYMDKKKIDIPFFGKIVDINNDDNRIKFEDKDGIIYSIDSWYVEHDNIFSMKEKETDTSSDKQIRHIMKLIQSGICSKNLEKSISAEDEIGSLLYDDEKDLVRMNNEINILKGLEKYNQLATEQMEREKDDDIEKYFERKQLLRKKNEAMLQQLDSLGIFEEIKFEESTKQRIEMEKSIKKKTDNQKTQSNPFADMFGLGLLNDLINMINEEDNLDLDDEEDDEDENESFNETTFTLNDNNGKSMPGKGPFPFGMGSIKPKDKKKEIPDCLIDMTALAAKGKYNDIIGREDELDTVAETLARKEIRNPLLIGKPGAGKTAVVEELVKRSYEGKIEHLKNKHFYELRMNDLVAGTMYRGQLEEKLQKVMKVLEDDPNVVLFIDEVHMIVQAGSTAEDKNDVANALKPYLTSEISIIGATTFDEYRATFENDGALARRFNPIAIEEKTKEEVVEIICKVKERFENYHHVELSEDIVRDIVDEIDNSKLDNSLIAGALTAVDTICTKMKIKHLSEEDAFDKWADEVVLGVDRTNKGGKTSKIGFVLDDEKEIKDEKENKDDVAKEMESLLEITIKDNKENTFALTENDIQEEIKTEEVNNTEIIENDKAEEFELEFEKIFKDYKTELISRDAFIKETGDTSIEGYYKYIDKLMDIIDEDEEESLESDDENSL